MIKILLLLLSGVQSAAVNVICELARKNPKNYLSLAPIFFKLMTTSSNNWMLIKIIKLVSISMRWFGQEKRINKFFLNYMYSKFASLTAIEPGLGRRLTQPLIEIISRFLDKQHVYFSNVFLIFDHCNYTL